MLEAYLDKAVLALNAGTLTAVDAAKAKLWATEVQHRVLDRCLQLFGGYGYIAEYPIARTYADARVFFIYGGTSEIMKATSSPRKWVRPEGLTLYDLVHPDSNAMLDRMFEPGALRRSSISGLGGLARARRRAAATTHRPADNALVLGAIAGMT